MDREPCHAPLAAPDSSEVPIISGVVCIYNNYNHVASYLICVMSETGNGTCVKIFRCPELVT